MLHTAQHLDDNLTHAFDSVGVVGEHLRGLLTRDLKAKIVLRAGRDAVEIIGAPGTGKHTVTQLAHTVARDVLGRSGPLTTYDCGRYDADELQRTIAAADGGTLVLDRFCTLEGDVRRSAAAVVRARDSDAMILAVSRRQLDPGSSEARTATTIRLKPLHERDEDVWELVDHFFGATAEDLEVTTCRGFSRQAKGDIAEVVQENGLASVRRLRDIVRDLVFEALADGPLPMKLTSEHVRPYLERTFGQTPQARAARDRALVASQFEGLFEPTMLERLAKAHDVPEDLLARQAQIIQEVVGCVQDVPQSYRNIMTKLEDISRASLWLMTGATTQAAFRRHFGDEGFMRPTKSVAWAFYNRVFQRDM